MAWRFLFLSFLVGNLCVNSGVDSQQMAQACFNPLGMQSRKIPDSAITESSFWSPIHTGRKARLRLSGAWYPKLSDKTPYIQVNLGERTNVTGLATQGYSGSYVKEYQLSYSLDGNTWRYYTENQATKNFAGNTFRNGIKTNRFNHVIVAQYIRVHPIKWSGRFSALRMELYGCPNQPHVGTPTPSLDLPGKPINLRGIKRNPTNITMAWDKPRGGSPAVTTYLVWYRARGSATSVNKVVTSTQVTMVSLLPYTVYDIKVQGWNQNGKGQWSDIRSLKTAESVPDRAPGNVRIASNAPMSLEVSWQRIPSNHLHGNFRGYVVFYQKLGDSSWNTIKVLPTTLTVLLSSLEPGAFYNVKVAGYTRVGTGKSSVTTSVAVREGAPSPPSNLQAWPAGPYSVHLTWQRPLKLNGHVRHYIIIYGESRAELNHHKTVPYSSTLKVSSTLTQLKPDTTYYVQVYAETSIHGQRSIVEVVRTFPDGSTTTASTMSSTHPKTNSSVPLNKSKMPTTLMVLPTEINLVTTDSEEITEPNVSDESTTTVKTYEPAAAAVLHKKEEKDDFFKLLIMTGVPAFVAFLLLVVLITVVVCRRKKKKSSANGELAMEMREVDRSGVTRGRGSTRYSAPADDVQKRCSCSSSKEQTLTRGNEYTRAPQDQAECYPLVDHEDKTHRLSLEKKIKSEEHIYAAIAQVAINPKKAETGDRPKHCYANQSEINAASRPHVYEYLDHQPRGPAYVNLPNAAPSNQASSAEGPQPVLPAEVLLELASATKESSTDEQSSPVPV